MPSPALGNGSTGVMPATAKACQTYGHDFVAALLTWAAQLRWRGHSETPHVTLLELYTDTQNSLCQSGFIKRVDHPEAGSSLLPSEPWHFSASAPLALRPSPRVGEHSREVLMTELGISENEYNALVEARVTGTLGHY